MAQVPLTTSKRDRRIDAIRGLLLVLMTIGHFDSLLARVTYECFGFFSVAEGFIFMSGFVFAILHRPLAGDPGRLFKVGLAKAFLIYRYHIALTVLLPLAAFAFPYYLYPWSFLAGPRFYHEPLLTTIMELFLLYQPRFMDILPLYCVFAILGPAILLGFKKGKTRVVLAISMGLWVIGQYVDPMIALAARLPNMRPGAFNLASWQLVWVSGMALGFWHDSGKPLPLMRAKPFLWTVYLLAAILFAARHGWVNLGFDVFLASQKPNLSWLRLLNFCLVVITIGSLFRYIPRHRGVPWLGFIGRHSLQVFAYQVMLLYLLFPLSVSLVQSGRHDAYAWLNVGIVISLSIPAGLHELYKARRSRRLRAAP